MDAELTAVIDIDATPDVVWAALTDFANYPTWNTFTSAEGTADVGARLTMRMPGMTFHPTVTVAEPGRQLRWEGTLGSRRIFHGQHTSTLTTNTDGSTRLTNQEQFTGLITTLTRPLLKTPKNDGYTAFNTALKHHIETSTQGGFNRSSQHLEQEVRDGISAAEAAGQRAGRGDGDAVRGTAAVGC